MRVKKFQAKSMPEAMKMVKAELGPDAIILHSRDTGRGFFGLLMGRGVEITAAVDTTENKKPAAPKRSNGANGNKSKLKTGGNINIQISDPPSLSDPPPLLDPAPKPKPVDEDLLRRLTEQLANDPRPQKPNGDIAFDQPKPSPSEQRKEKRLEERIARLESHIHKLTGMIEHLVPSLTSGDVPAVPQHTRELYNHLLEQDVDERLALSIAARIAETIDEKDDAWTALKTHLISRIPVAPPIEIDFDVKKPKVLMLVGPTGVGKTTTLAKISAQYRSVEKNRRPKIVFITADLYRLAAVEQLQKYTEILGSHLEVTYSPDEVTQALNKHKEAHLILFDTAGTSQRNMPQMTTLAGIVDAAQPTEVHLVLSATTKFSDAVDIIEHFQAVKPTRLIFSKIDEATTYGTILNSVSKFNIPISYLTVGQNVPEDIEFARQDRIVKLLMTKPAVNRSIISLKDGLDDPDGKTPSNKKKPEEKRQTDPSVKDTNKRERTDEETNS